MSMTASAVSLPAWNCVDQAEQGRNDLLHPTEGQMHLVFESECPNNGEAAGPGGASRSIEQHGLADSRIADHEDDRTVLFGGIQG